MKKRRRQSEVSKIAALVPFTLFIIFKTKTQWPYGPNSAGPLPILDLINLFYGDVGPVPSLKEQF